jgi:hypothetical protein
MLADERLFVSHEGQEGNAFLFVLDLNVHLGAWHQLGNPCAPKGYFF